MLRSLLRSSSIALSAFVFLASSSALFAQGAPDCSAEKTLKSPPSTAATELSFQNRAGDKRRIYWIDQEGDRKFYGVLEPGNVFRQQTMADHAWVVTDDSEKCLYVVVASPEPRVVDVGQAAVVVAPPPPGGQQPIAQAAPPVQQQVAPVQQVAPPAAVVQAPPSEPVAVVQAPPPAPMPPPVAAAAAPRQTADDRLPQISPVEQFQLTGTFRLGSRLDPGKFLNSQASGAIDVVAAKPEWDSAQWTYEAVRGTPFVRIKSKWKGTYLADYNGKPRAMPASPDATEAHWTFEPVDGTDFVQFRNRETDRFLLNINGAAAVVDSFGQELENSSHWRSAPLGSAVVASVQQRPRYDAAVANCREIGGYWTGSSCRRPVYLTEPLRCPRGFIWAEDVGECLWDEGGCPPWQMGPGGVCGVNLVCRGGAVAPGRRGFPACYCPPGEVAWGNYPNLSCVPSITRVAPYLIPAVVGGVALGIISGGTNRPQIGTVFGNKQNCGPGQTGTPPNCVAAQTCKPPLVGTPPNCLRQFPNPNPTAIPIANPTTTPVPTPTTTPGVIPTPTPTQTPTGGAVRACANNEAIASGCRCEAPMRAMPNGTCFVTPGAGQACLDGQNMSGGCLCLLQKFDVAGGGSVCATRAPTTPGVVPTPTPTQTPTGGAVRACGNNEAIASGCRCEAPMRAMPNGTCFATPGAGQACLDGQNMSGGCVCLLQKFTVAGGGSVCASKAPSAGTTTCQIGETKDAAGNCVKLNASITCTGGRIEQGVCGCPTGTTLQGGGTNFQCVATGGGQIGTATTATVDPKTGIQTTRTTDPKTGQTTTTQSCAAGFTGTPPTCVAANTGGGGQIGTATTATVDPNTGIQTTRTTDPKTGQTTTTQTCAAGFTGTPPQCTKQGGTPPPQPVGGPPVCADGQNTASGCRCAAPLTVLPGGKCAQPTKPGAACLEGQNIAQTGCNCVAPLKQIENGFCGRLLLNETRPLTKGGNCTEGQDIKATGCNCLMKTVDAGGGRFICSANATATPQPVGGPPVCADGQNTASGCRCAAPLTVLPGGKCAQPTKPGAACLEGQNIAQTGCNCVAPLKQIENGFCGRLLLNETRPLTKGANCTEGQDIKATGCNCLMKTVDAGGGRFICSTNAPPSGVRLAPQNRPGGTTAPAPTPTPTATPTGAPRPVATPTPTPTVVPKLTPTPTPTTAPKVTPSPTPTSLPKPTTTTPPPPKSVTTPPPPPPLKPVTAPPPPPKPATPPPPPPPPKSVTAPPPPPPSKPVTAPPPPPPPRPATPPPPNCAPPKKLNPAGQCV